MILDTDANNDRHEGDWVDGNKRPARVALTVFCALNGRHLAVPPDDAVALMLGIAGGEKNEGDVAAWLGEQIHSSNG